jgi:hypothetical protein
MALIDGGADMSRPTFWQDGFKDCMLERHIGTAQAPWREGLTASIHKSATYRAAEAAAEAAAAARAGTEQ